MSTNTRNELSIMSIGLVFAALCAGAIIGNIIEIKRVDKEILVSTRGVSLKAIREMRDTCERTLPRNQTCELTFTPYEVLHGRVVEESPGSTD